MEEMWRKIPGIDKGYEASNTGYIRGISRIVAREFKSGKIAYQEIPETILRPSKCKNGYLYVSLKGKSYQVHRLVARAWVEGYAEGLDACHKNGKRHENAFDNLAWKTRKENLADQILHGTKLQGETQNGAVLTEELIQQMKTLKLSGYSYESIAKTFGVATMTVWNALNNKTWIHLKQKILQIPNLIIDL